MTVHAYVGAFTTPDRNGRGDGLHVYAIDAPLGPWRHLQHLGGLENPSFLIANRAGTRLYVVHGGRSQASALARAADGNLSVINTVEVDGLNPVDLALDLAERTLVVACYGSGTVSVVPVDETGRLGRCRQRIVLSGPPGPDPREQASPHPHGVTFDPSGRFVLVPDKGTDRVFVFVHEPAGGMLAPAPTAFLQLPPGCGPRHLAFHPGGTLALIVNELGCSVMAARWDRDSGTLGAGPLVSTLRQGAGPGSFAAEIAVSADGRSAYASNRVDDSIAVFDVAEGRSLQLRQTHPAGGRTPRAFAVAPDGAALYVANQDSDALVVLARDARTGELSPAGRTLRLGSPVAIVLVPTG